jgi:hypothetical protein
MTKTQETESQRRARLRWVTLGEAIAIAALILSGLGLWHEWNRRDDPKVVVEKPTAIRLALRGHVTDEGRQLEIAPIESGHALQSLTVSVPTSGSVIEVGSDGEISARAIESALNRVGDRDKGTHRLNVRIAAKYVEAGTDKSATGAYVISYKWEGGGLLGGKSLRVTGFGR